MKFRFKPLMLGMAMAVGVGASLNGGSAVAASVQADKLPTADWTYDVPAGNDLGWVFDSGNATKDCLYFTLFTPEGGSTQVQSFDRKDGSKNWIHNIKGEAQSISMFGQPMISPVSGDVYYAAKKDNEKSYKLYAVSAQGKLKWSKPVDVEFIGALQIQPNEDIMLTTGSLDYKTTTVYNFSKDGKLKKKSTVSGSKNLAVLPNGQVANTIGQKLELYPSINDLSKPAFSYSLPKQTTVATEFRSWDKASRPAIYSFNGGKLVGLEWNEQVKEQGPGAKELDPADVKRSTTFVFFDSKGKKGWERKLPKGAVAIPAGENLLVKNGLKLELYGPDNKLKKSKTFEAKDFLLNKAPNGEIVMSAEAGGDFYALNAKDLSVNHHISLEPSADGKKKYGFLYAGEGKLYIHDAEADGSSVSAYTLK
ncbi:outer membrane protein assembly factor BamB family protein [Saccharibacillus alkalitolerans]|uniref:PQQ-binding-like beta-propeller repeat protein n=1 Tax=Saccharibacillus alkalitolerans TaxID=2705290 RepID=A0ABX0F8E7_9BACL|nr:PQQ-binding-like beta-propeller repeat protein [Saccharibacillus alkalitolerans]NGZ77242.1 PQQ-binding-like beta-propeller repeat protein [Saccharibacillus alkalitolerans]